MKQVIYTFNTRLMKQFAILQSASDHSAQNDPNNPVPSMPGNCILLF